MSGETGYHAGISAEQAVARRYERLGGEIAARRWRGAGGEIDLVVRDGSTLVFIEVKKSRSFARAAERCSRRQQIRIWNTAAEYLGDTVNGLDSEARFDLALVDELGRVQVLKNAFGH